MHETALAIAILDTARRYQSPGTVLKRVAVRAGAMRMIDRPAMQLAWEGLMQHRGLGGVELKLEVLAWQLRCRRCAREWEGADLPETCSCGADDVHPAGDDQLVVLSIDVE